MKSHLSIATASIMCFADDGTLDHAELDSLMDIALLDKVIDDDEKRVLGKIFEELNEDNVHIDVWYRIAHIKEKHGIL